MVILNGRDRAQGILPSSDNPTDLKDGLHNHGRPHTFEDAALMLPSPPDAAYYRDRARKRVRHGSRLKRFKRRSGRI